MPTSQIIIKLTDVYITMSVNDESGQTSIVNHDTHYEQTINNTDVMLTNYDQ